MPTDEAPAITDEFVTALRRMGLLSSDEPPPVLTPLTGGVSSDIVRADLAGGPICLKRALAKLKVRADWRAPVERNRFELQWMRVAGAIVPDAVPRVLGEDASSGTFAMEFLDPADYAVWKTALADGNIDARFAAQVGGRVARIHRETANRPELHGQFATDHIFFPIRLEPYLAATALAHRDCAAALHTLVQITGSTKLALVHGDVSPKNILIGRSGPVFLDAECAWYGDPAFDLAFCLNHLLLKCAWRPQWSDAYLGCFDSLAAAYLAEVAWESPVALERRAAALLPGLFLGRVDGKSPVEYITAEWQRDAVRDVARRFLLEPTSRLDDIAQHWRKRLLMINA